MRSILQWFGLAGIKSRLNKIEVERVQETKPVKDMPEWAYQNLRAKAHDKSAARAAFKKHLGLKRLPVGAVVELASEAEEAAA